MTRTTTAAKVRRAPAKGTDPPLDAATVKVAGTCSGKSRWKVFRLHRDEHLDPPLAGLRHRHLGDVSALSPPIRDAWYLDHLSALEAL
ncbi:MAG: hypothetical protein M3406_06070 [Chloroflexota bacterium]|nr:hypothetical protein [Chloroflexota bacterium]